MESTMPSASAQPITRTQILRTAWPIILANAAVPLLGLADTAVIGNYASLQDLGAVAFGAIIFSFVYWSFGFLRMGTTGFVAQADGAGDEAEVRAALLRSLLLAAGLGLMLIVLQKPIASVALFLLDGSEQVEAIALNYFFIRIWGAPATLGLFALMGILIGLGKSKTLLLLQLFLNGLNILLDIYFTAVLGWGAEGIALGTAIAEWTTLLLAVLLIARMLKRRHSDQEAFLPLDRLADRAKLRRTLSANADIMIRTMLLVFSFSWFIKQSAQFGDVTLAANHILLQLISFSAFFLDGYAFVVESITGKAAGARRPRQFDQAVRRSSELAAFTALLLAAVIILAGPLVIDSLTSHEPVRDVAGQHLPLVSLYVMCAFAAFQLDGIFIGATRTREMRNASIVSVGFFIPLSLLLMPWAGNNGLWLAFIAYVIIRAVALGVYFPRLRRGLARASQSKGCSPSG